jgi:hypothetical protein
MKIKGKWKEKKKVTINWLSKCDNSFRDTRSLVQMTVFRSHRDVTLTASVGTGANLWSTSLTNAIEAVTASEASDEE